MTEQSLTEAEAERLSLIRYQLLSAQEALSAPPPISSLSINVMQDVVESTLSAAGDHIRAEVRNRDFDKLFDAVVSKLGNPAELVGLRAPAIALNNARVGFKHHGNHVRDETLRRHMDVSVTLVSELVQAAFDVDLNEVSMLLFVRDDQVRLLVQSADEVGKSGNLIDGLFRLRLAFDLAVQEYELRKTYDGWHSVFDTKPAFYPSVFDLERFAGREGGRHLERMTDWIDALATTVKLGAIGVDLQRYAYFDSVAPSAIYMGSDHPTHSRVRFENPTQQHFDDAYRFVVDTVIYLAANDYTLTPNRHRQIYRDRHFDPEYEGTPMWIHPSLRGEVAGDVADETEENPA
ncbi:hypothetical protein [Microbacterium rhizomatis]|uniref:Uncharacterized protein n=1 Tax=Microbacterium rhizomatis TaxID=1631477 RepID=A0A5J5J3L8_9MICO|nr:hypothetical protein [Microbacterium rhizomatis]KAA9108050.1 hypothetical protein F6B43_11585 [Microbacterium rhizomatis]